MDADLIKIAREANYRYLKEAALASDMVRYVGGKVLPKAMPKKVFQAAARGRGGEFGARELAALGSKMKRPGFVGPKGQAHASEAWSSATGRLGGSVKGKPSVGASLPSVEAVKANPSAKVMRAQAASNMLGQSKAGGGKFVPRAMPSYGAVRGMTPATGKGVAGTRGLADAFL